MLRQIELGRETDAPRRVVLNPAPTPLLPAPALAKALGGPALWMKRDDLIPFGLGGNKIRGLELILADALQMGADTLVTVPDHSPIMCGQRRRRRPSLACA